MKITQTVGQGDDIGSFKANALDCIQNGTTVLQDGTIMVHTVREERHILTMGNGDKVYAEAEITEMGIDICWQVWADVQISYDADAIQPILSFKSLGEASEAAEMIKNTGKYAKTYSNGTTYQAKAKFSHIQKAWK